MSNLIRSKVVIVGCGPVGIFGSLLLEHFCIDYCAFQKYSSPRSHPSAHWLSANSKALFSQIPNLVSEVNSCQQPWENFRYYRYLQSLFGHQIGITDHFQPSIQQKLHRSRQLFGQQPSHIPQNILLEILYGKLKNKNRLIFDKEIKEIKRIQNGSSKQNFSYILYDQNNNPVAQSKYVVLCSGVNSSLKNKLPQSISQFRMQGNQNILNIINIHFTSKQLANKLKNSNQNAMLHFIYTKKIIAILVNHSIDKTGTFVLQIPNFQPFVDLLQLYSARELISMIFNEAQSEIVKNINVVHVGKWKLQGILSESMYKENIFLAGDSAHAYPPAGGFGMNSGFQDISQLIHSIYLVEKNPHIDPAKAFTNFSQNRVKVNSQYLRKAMQNYDITKSISSQLGYSPNIMDYFSNSSILNGVLNLLPGNKSNILEPIRTKAMQLMYRRPLFQKNPSLNLFFDQFDQSIQNISKIRKQVTKNISTKNGCSPSVYARSGDISIKQIKELIGDLDEKNIQFYKNDSPQYANGQRLISSDGNILLL